MDSREARRAALYQAAELIRAHLEVGGNLYAVPAAPHRLTGADEAAARTALARLATQLEQRAAKL